MLILMIFAFLRSLPLEWEMLIVKFVAVIYIHFRFLN